MRYRRSRLIIFAVVAFLLYIFIQLYMLKWMRKQGDKMESSDSSSRESLSKEDTIPFRNVKDFIEVCEDYKLEVTLIDPSILYLVMHNNSHHRVEPCKYLCSHRGITTFGILGKNFISQKAFVDKLRDKNYDVAEVYDKIPSQRNLKHKEVEILTHIVMLRKTFYIHLVIFIEKKGNFLWHGPFRWNKTNPSIPLDPRLLDFGQNAGAYDRFETVKVKIDEIKMSAPRYPLDFLKEVAHSKYLECNQTTAVQFFTTYGHDTSTEALLFRKKARSLLAQAKKTLDELGIRFWLSSGTCLGWFRQCDIIPYSKDVDLGIWIKDYDVRLMPAMEMSGMHLTHLFGKVQDSYELSFQGGDIKLDIFFFYEESDHVWNGGTQARTGNKYKYTFPKFTLCWTEFLDLKVRVPCETEQYIEANYGKEWFHPVKEWDWKKSPPNVKENGQWVEEEMSKVVQMFN